MAVAVATDEGNDVTDRAQLFATMLH